MSLLPRLLNYSDVEGRPICPTCGRAILPAQGVVRVEDCMVHVSCYPEARDQDEPCEPAP